MITLEHIAMEYTPGQPILKDVSLTLERGSFHFLTGPSVLIFSEFCDFKCLVGRDGLEPPTHTL